MKRQNMPMYAIALAIVVVGALALGVPASSLVFGLLVLACPLMMLFMHGGHDGGGHDGHQTEAPEQKVDLHKDHHGTARPY
jgi:hypothetical protein